MLLINAYHVVPWNAFLQTLCLPHVVLVAIVLRYISFMVRDPACRFHGQAVDVVLLWSILVNPLLTDETVVRVADGVRVVLTSVLLQRVLHENSGRTTDLVAETAWFVASVIVSVVDHPHAWAAQLAFVALRCAATFARLDDARPYVVRLERLHCTYLPERGERHFVFQADPVNMLVIGLSVAAGWALAPRAYADFLAHNAIHERIGFNNMCVYFDLFPFSTFAGVLMFANAIDRVGHFVFAADRASRLLQWPLLVFLPYYLLIFMVSPQRSLLFHSIGYVLFILSELLYLCVSMWRGDATRSLAAAAGYGVGAALVGVYAVLAVLALGTDVPLGTSVNQLGWALDTLIFVMLVLLSAAHIFNVVDVYAIHVTVLADGPAAAAPPP